MPLVATPAQITTSMQEADMEDFKHVIQQQPNLADSPSEEDDSTLTDSTASTTCSDILQIEIPAGVQVGQCRQIRVPHGRRAMVIVPTGYSSGMELQCDFIPADGTRSF